MGILSVRPAALLVLLARTAGAGIVATDFGGATHDLLNRRTISGASHPGLFEFAAFASLEGLFNIVD